MKKNLRFIYIPENLRLGNGLEIFLKSSSIIIGLRNLSDKKIINNLIDLGVNGIITDEPELLMETMKERDLISN